MQQREPKEWLLAAYKAATKSTDLSTHNGAIIVAPNNVVIQACNEVPKRIKQKAERFQRPLKYDYTEHAERNAIYEAARLGISVQGCTMYVPWYACSDCARAIIQSGIAKIVGHKQMSDKTSDYWKESVKIGLEMLEEAGVKMELLDVEFNGPKVLFNGSWWTP